MMVWVMMLLVVNMISRCTLAHESFHVDPDDEHMKEHLQEHLDDVADGVELDSEDSVYFGYFKVHDTDNDGYMDGLELLHSFGDHRKKNSEGIYTDEQYEQDLKSYVEIVDITLSEFDKDNDGKISFPEYISQMKSSREPKS